MAPKIWVRAITAAAAVGLLIPCGLTGQGRGAATTPPTTGTGNGLPAPRQGPPTPVRQGAPRQPSTTQPDQHRRSTPTGVNIPQPIFLSGRVMMEDGTPPPDPVVIETVCNGVAALRRLHGYERVLLDRAGRAQRR